VVALVDASLDPVVVAPDSASLLPAVELEAIVSPTLVPEACEPSP
jgi:hypothetical protein